ncbi:MAG TPA: hypothetical protein VLH94_01570 [Spirochaetia bacterium]|nr:hypothetical protein [Spirochaetia bacterium]
MNNTGAINGEVSFEKIQKEVEEVLNDPLLGQEDWTQCICWGKARLVGLTNKVLDLPDPRNKKLLADIDHFAQMRGYQIGIRL